jgi:monoamine oxidase
MPHDYLGLIRDGLSKASTPKRVVIVGAGMAGLTAGHELLRAGHVPVILEAQQRVGGRVFTLREPFTHGLYAEAGAMRIPKSHALTMAYIEKFKVATGPFTMGNPEGYYYLRGRRWRAGEAAKNPDALGYDTAPHERGLSIAKLWEQALAPLAARVDEEGASAWRSIVAECDHFSTREFLESRGWSEGAIEMFGLLFDQEAILNSSFLELLREELGGYYTNMLEIAGGSDHLPRAFLPELAPHIHFGAKMIAIDQSADAVAVHYQTAGGRFTERGDFAIITVPFPVLRHVEAIKPLSHAKARAIRQLHYDASAKILMQFRRRFWEDDDKIFGGGTLSDLPIRITYYPDHSRETGRGVVLVSYTWGEDAQRWGSLPPADRLSQALENLAVIHPQAPREFEAGTSWMWHDDQYAGGAFALFDPGQQTLLYPHIIAPEGRIHFAGEHASLGHAWIQGAIESGLRAGVEICARA